MRITGGRARGRILMTPKGYNIRPTSDRVREAIFNIIGQDLSGLRVLDLFSGTGGLGIEALSRGAFPALFVDCSPDAVRLVEENLARCGFRDVGAVIRWDLNRGLPVRHPFMRDPAHLVFLDPPYGQGALVPLLGKLSPGRVLEKGARVVAETRKTETLPGVVGKMERVLTRTYGDTRISVYETAQ